MKYCDLEALAGFPDYRRSVRLIFNIRLIIRDVGIIGRNIIRHETYYQIYFSESYCIGLLTLSLELANK